jgi:hypothetical protein
LSIYDRETDWPPYLCVGEHSAANQSVELPAWYNFGWNLEHISKGQLTTRGIGAGLFQTPLCQSPSPSAPRHWRLPAEMTTCRTRLLLGLVVAPFLLVLGWYQILGFRSPFFSLRPKDSGPFAWLRDPPFIFSLCVLVCSVKFELCAYNCPSTRSGDR